MENTIVLNLKPTKNTINRDLHEMKRIKGMYDRKQITKLQAVDLFQDYLLQTRGRCAMRPFPYKVAA